MKGARRNETQTKRNESRDVKCIENYDWDHHKSVSNAFTTRRTLQCPRNYNLLIKRLLKQWTPIVTISFYSLLVLAALISRGRATEFIRRRRSQWTSNESSGIDLWKQWKRKYQGEKIIWISRLSGPAVSKPKREKLIRSKRSIHQSHWPYFTAWWTCEKTKTSKKKRSDSNFGMPRSGSVVYARRWNNAGSPRLESDRLMFDDLYFLPFM